MKKNLDVQQVVKAGYGPTPDLLAVSIVFAALGLFFEGMAVFAPRLGDGSNAPAALFGLLVLLLLPALWIAACWRRAEIIADADGISWRGIGRCRRAAWHEVEDFYSCAVSSTLSKFYVETRAGNFSFSISFRNSPALIEAIARRANSLSPQGIAGRTRDWRAENAWPQHFGLWPHVFDYNAYENRILPPLFFVVAPYWAVVPFARLGALSSGQGLQTLRDIASQLSWPILVLGALLFGLFQFGTPLLMLFAATSQVRNGKRGERIILTARGVFHHDTAHDYWRMVAWPDVQLSAKSFERKFWPPPSVLDTPVGPISWTNNIGNRRLLTALLHAANPALSDAMTHAAEAHSAETLVPTRRESDGTLVFNYRTRSGRMMLLGGVVIMCAMPVQTWLRLQGMGPHESADIALCIFASGMLVIATIVGAWVYFRAEVRVDERGLEKRTPFKRSFVAWTDVRELVHRKDGSYLVRGQEAWLSFSHPTSDFRLLRAEIAQRAAQDWIEHANLTEQNTSSTV